MSSAKEKVSYFRLVLSQSVVTDEVLQHEYPGDGTEASPYAVDFIQNDPRNPMLIPKSIKWCIAIIMALGTLSVSLASTAISGALQQVEQDFNVDAEVSILTVSLFVLGFAIGPMSWAPMSELFGRQIIYFITFGLSVLFGACSIASQNIQTLLVLRFLSGAIGASSIVNSAGVISDIFTARERGLAITVYCSAPFLGPTLGPVCGGFLGQAAGWRWVDALGVLFCAALWILGSVFVPETYTPYLLQRRAAKLSKLTGKFYKSKLEVDKGTKSAGEIFKVAMVRPWILLFFEPIVLMLAIYAAVVYGILYMQFSAFPLIFEVQRKWSQGISGLSFLGVAIGQIFAMFFYVYLDVLYKRDHAKAGGRAAPEARLLPAMVGGSFLPIGLFWFAWTIYPSIHWIVPLIGTSFFGFGQVLLFISLMNYTIDAYTVFAASSLAANAIFRALFGFAFPLFTTQMYENLGFHWAASIPAFLSLACLPFPFLFHRYGARIRASCKYSTEADRIMAAMMSQMAAAVASKTDDKEAQADSGGDTPKDSGEKSRDE